MTIPMPKRLSPAAAGKIHRIVSVASAVRNSGTEFPQDTFAPAKAIVATQTARRNHQAHSPRSLARGMLTPSWTKDGTITTNTSAALLPHVYQEERSCTKSGMEEVRQKGIFFLTLVWHLILCDACRNMRQLSRPIAFRCSTAPWAFSTLSEQRRPIAVSRNCARPFVFIRALCTA